VAKWLAALGSFVRLWLILLLGYFGFKVIANLLIFRAIDLRQTFFVDLAIVPLGQSLVFWLVTRRMRSRDNAAASLGTPA